MYLKNLILTWQSPEFRQSISRAEALSGWCRELKEDTIDDSQGLRNVDRMPAAIVIDQAERPEVGYGPKERVPGDPCSDSFLMAGQCTLSPQFRRAWLAQYPESIAGGLVKNRDADTSSIQSPVKMYPVSQEKKASNICKWLPQLG
jgi:hypothetical protein